MMGEAGVHKPDTQKNKNPRPPSGASSTRPTRSDSLPARAAGFVRRAGHVATAHRADVGAATRSTLAPNRHQPAAR